MEQGYTLSNELAEFEAPTQVPILRMSSFQKKQCFAPVCLNGSYPEEVGIAQLFSDLRSLINQFLHELAQRIAPFVDIYDRCVKEAKQ